MHKEGDTDFTSKCMNAMDWNKKEVENVSRRLLRISDSKKETEICDARWFSRKRYYVAILCCAGMVIGVIQRLNLSIALVEMTSNRTFSVGNKTYVQPAEFNWTPLEIGLILSCFSWGFLISPVAATLAQLSSGTFVYGAGLAVTGILTIFTPFLFRFSTYAYLVSRFLEGVAEGFCLCVVSDIFIYWSPEHERSRLVSVFYSGINFGPCIAYPLCGFLTKWFGWEIMFFISGACSIFWFLIWISFVSSSPANDRFISKTEKNYLSNIRVHKNVKSAIPWKQILSSKSIWAFINERFVEAWSISFVFYCIPLYVKDMYNEGIDQIGIISGLPNLAAIIGIILFSTVNDYLRNMKKISISKIHKLMILTGQISSIIVLTIMITWMDFVGTIICLTLFRFVYAMSETCYFVMPLDIAEQYSHFVTGLGVTALTFGYTLNPIILNLMVSNHTFSEWRKYFIFLAGFNVWGAVIFFLFGSGEQQSFNKTNNDGSDAENMRNNK